MQTTFKLFLLPLLFVSCYIGTELPPDQKVWEYDQPDNVGLSNETMLLLDSAVEADFFQSIKGLIVIKDDKLVFENYYDSLTRHSTVSIDRASIVYTVAAVGAAIDEGLISLSDPINTFLPGYDDIFQSDALKNDITIEHLLTHRSGISWNETIVVPDNNNNLIQMFNSPDWIDFILNQPMEAVPGIRYNFNSGSGTILTKIIENATGRSFDEYLQQTILEPIGISNFSIDTDPTGNFNGGRGVTTTLIDFTRFGYLMLQDGIWNGRKVIDANFVDASNSLQSPVSPSFNLGYGWWLFGDNFEGFFPFEREDAYFIPGEIGQHLYVIPDENMIVSIYAENFFFGFNNPSLNLFAQISTAIQ